MMFAIIMLCNNNVMQDVCNNNKNVLLKEMG